MNRTEKTRIFPTFLFWAILLALLARDAWSDEPLFPWLAIEKTAPASAFVGEPFTYTLSVSNFNHVDALDVTITDPVPANAQVESIGPPGVLSGSQAVWELPVVALGATEVVTFSVSGLTAGTVINAGYSVTASNALTVAYGPPIIVSILKTEAPTPIPTITPAPTAAPTPTITPTPTVTPKPHCDQGVGNGPDGCDPGKPKRKTPKPSNDEGPGTGPGNPGRKGGK